MKKKKPRSQPVLPISRPASIAAKAVSDQVAEPTPADLERGGKRPRRIASAQSSRGQVRRALLKAREAMDTWTALFAGDMCSARVVRAARRRVNEAGTLAYIADVNAQLQAALAQLASTLRPSGPKTSA